MRVAGFARSASNAPSSYSGAITSSMNCSASSPASSALTGRLSASTIPYAETGSASWARRNASSIERETATPAGFACLTTTAAGSWNSPSSRRAAERSLRLLNESCLPVQLVDPGEEMPPRALLDVVRGALVRVLPVREVGGLREAGDEAVGKRLASQEPASRSPSRRRRSSRRPRPPGAAGCRRESRPVVRSSSRISG